MITTKSEAEARGVSRQTINQWIKSGKIAAVRFGKRYVIGGTDAVKALDASIVLRTSKMILEWLRVEAGKRSMSLNLLLNEIIFAYMKGQTDGRQEKRDQAEVGYGDSIGKKQKKKQAISG
jgi:excisionase family DNA binding protein